MEVKKTGEFKGRLDVEGITSCSSDFVHVNFLSILIPPRGVGRAGVAVAVYGPLVFFFAKQSSPHAGIRRAVRCSPWRNVGQIS